MAKKKTTRNEGFGMSHKKVADLLKKQEELLPELQECVVDRGIPPLIVHHPLLVTAITTNAMINHIYRSQLQFAEQAKADEDWLTYIMLHAQPYQIGVFRKVAQKMSDAEYWSLLGEIYTMSENVRQYKATIRKLLSSNRPRRDMIMTGSERAYFRRLPSKITIYRGYAHRNAAGWSWTLDKTKATWFACRFAKCGRHAGQPRVATGNVDKTNVIAYFSRRKEKEILVDPRNVVIESKALV